MYHTILVIHSIYRWIVLLSLIYAIYRFYKGWISNKTFSVADNKLRIWTTNIAYIQLLIGIILFFTSPMMQFFINNFKIAVKQKDIRFFAMEHSLMMIIAMVIIAISSIMAKRKVKDLEKYRSLAIWFSIAFVLIFLFIPWSFLPFANRPYFRFF